VQIPFLRYLSTRAAHLLRGFAPAMGRRPMVDILRTTAGTGLGLLAAAMLVYAMPGSRTSGIYLVSSLASTAVLIFVLPNSPLSQPWSAIVGNTVSALVAVAVLYVIPPPFADALAVALAIVAMMALRALHPPAAGIALLPVLEFEAENQLGFSFALMPIATITIFFVLLGVIWHAMTGRVYPLRRLKATPPDAGLSSPGTRARASALPRETLEALLLDLNQSSNLGPADLARLLEAAEARAEAILFTGTLVEEVMTPSPVSVAPDTPISDIVRRLADLGTKSVPVTDSEGTYLGLVDQEAVMLRLAQDLAVQRRRFRGLRTTPTEAEAAAIMASGIPPVERGTTVGALLERFSRRSARAIPVTEAGRLIGIITRTDLIRLLLDRRHTPVETAVEKPI
jgi:CBS domain-containing membrane protein